MRDGAGQAHFIVTEPVQHDLRSVRRALSQLGRELGIVGGRLAIWGAGEWFVERLGLYRNFIRVVSGSPVA